MTILLIIALAAFLIPIVIYVDAVSNNIGKIKGEKDFLNLSAGGWGLAAALPILWMFTGIAYLLKRKELLMKAQLQPVMVPTAQRGMVIAALLVTSAITSSPWLLITTAAINLKNTEHQESYS